MSGKGFKEYDWTEMQDEIRRRLKRGGHRVEPEKWEADDKAETEEIAGLDEFIDNQIDREREKECEE